MKNKPGMVSRLLLLVAAAGLVIVIFTPIWRIELNAPQYPEGLSLTIHANGLKGNVDIINGLNHYIGMKTLHNEDFFEFAVLPYIIAFFAIAFLVVAIINKRQWLNILFVLFVTFGVIAIIDFWKWEYNYGHNLNPSAAIVVPGMAYQPPLIGFKQLLNFGAYSIPDTGGWIFIAAGLILMTCVIMEWRRYKVAKVKPVFAASIVLLFPILLFSSCSPAPEPIVTGRDNCYLCKMGISDVKYGGEIVTKKGKTYKFDDLHCLLSYFKSDPSIQEQVKDIYVVDFSGNHSLVNVNESFFLQGDNIHGPMNGNMIAFQSRDSLQSAATRLNAIDISWKDLSK
jgi:copper chaperone NosL